MPKLFNLFIQQPYSRWALGQNYGDPLATDASRISDHIVVSTDMTDGVVFAVCSGELSVAAPASNAVGFEELSDELPDQSLPATVDLWLMMNPTAALIPELFTGLQGLTGIGDPNSSQIAFVYYNVDVASMMEALREQIRWSTIPPAEEDMDDDELRRRVSLFLQGRLSVLVDSGNPLGRAAASSDANSFTPFQIGFGVTTALGPASPGSFFDSMRPLIDEAQDVDEFLVLVPKPPTAFSAAASKAEAIQLTAGTIYPYPDLEGLRQDRSLTRSEWRTVGNQQKALYRRQLLARYGLLPQSAIAQPFEFSVSDCDNLFQLEAVVEFFANFTDPSAPNALPIDVSSSDHSDIDRTQLVIEGTTATLVQSGQNRVIQLDGNPDLSKVQKFHHFIFLSQGLPVQLFRIVDVSTNQVTAIDSNGNTPAGQAGPVGPWRINLYTEVDFIPLAGDGAQINGNQVTLPNATSLERLKTLSSLAHDGIRAKCLCDGIIFDAEPSKIYLIDKADPANSVLRLKNPPQFAATTSAWQISHVPTLVMIDPVGPRLRGTEARIPSATSASVIDLGAAADLKKVNTQSFETIHLVGDTARPSRTYRILDKDNTAHTVTLDGNPSLPNGLSEWYIPAGVGAPFETLKYSLGPGTGQFDHYDGLLFMIDNGKVTTRHRWTSYTSRTQKLDNRRSIRGNHRYELFSLTSTSPPKKGGDYRNYCFRLNDRFNDHLQEPLDSVFSQARNYFDPNVPEGDQRHIRIHYGDVSGSGGTGSAGCNVSPEFFKFRKEVIEIYQTRYTKALGVPERDTEVDLLPDDYNNSAALQRRSFPATPPATAATDPVLLVPGWEYKIFCYYWLIRPDERPIS